MQLIRMDALHSMLLQIMVSCSSKKGQRTWISGEAGVMAVLVGVPGVNVNATDASGNTPLHLAIVKGISEFTGSIWPSPYVNSFRLNCSTHNNFFR